jgi:siroheme synthase-like protein
MLDITGRQIVIVGGGAVASRKAAGVVCAGAKKVKVIATEFVAEFDAEIERIHRPYQPGDLKDAELAFAATDSATINDAVVQEAESLGIWVNRADTSDEIPGDFATPAKFQSGSITVTVSAGSAALSTVIRDGLEQRFDPAWTAMADAMKTLRPVIKSSGLDAAARAGLFRRLATPQAIATLRDRGIEGLKNWINQQT